MNKKGFTLVELILVVVIIGIISAITIPNIMEALDESKAEGGESIEKMLEQNLELYNTDSENDIWCLSYSGISCNDYNIGIKNISIGDLYNKNPDIDMGQCLLQPGDSLTITRAVDGTYTYTAKIICSKNFDSFNDDDKIATEAEANTTDFFYKTGE